ncbi:cytochrome bc complex cytochrome b subunit [Nonomuraea sp. NPDC050556]|uniref:cytochrome bc complex cytochrome b subunit n=1 Tax=Nonomuraea sp. NPDC050556 TaxID=3364369 RepID=UPI0037AB0D55
MKDDQLSTLLWQATLYTFVVLVVTGGFLTFFYVPDMTQVTYQGSYGLLRGVTVSRAFASSLDLSFEVRGGLLIRQIHHWAALYFVAAICLQLLRLFFTRAFRRPRLLVWMVWVTLLPLGMVMSLTGSILPDDMLSGGSLRLTQGVVQSIPMVGTWLAGVIFDGAFPGTEIIGRVYWLHLALPVLTAGLMLYVWLRRTGRSVAPVRVFAATAGLVTVMGAFVQINAIWQLGPYRPGSITAGAVPGWYMGFLDGAVRIMPGWEATVFGHTLTLAVLVPAVVVPGVFFTVLGLYPFVERRFPISPATHVAVGAAGIAFYGLLWAAAANDQIAYNFHFSLFSVTWFFRVAVLVVPALVFVLVRKFAFQERQADESGVIIMTPGGGFAGEH